MNRIYFNEHITNIHGAHPTCPFCQIGFWNLPALKKNIDTAHKEEEKVQSNLKCSQCEFQSMDDKILKEHIKNTHKDAQKCPFCKIDFSCLDVLRKHIDTDHREDQSLTLVNSKKGPCFYVKTKAGCKNGFTT